MTTNLGLIEPLDLTNCDREPIHLPGTIQPHGALLVVDEAWTVVQASANSELVLGHEQAALLGRGLDMLLPGDDLAAVQAAVTSGTAGGGATYACTATVSGGGRRFDCLVHRNAAGVVLELEPALPRQRVTSADDAYALLRRAVGRLQQTESVREFCQTAAEEIRALTGFDRVMMYQFMEDGHGVVIAETRRDDLEPFLGLHYPASDIPQQARALYLRNWLRLIPDVHYQPSPVLPAANPATGAPLDMSQAVLRSVSPIHIEYLHNMGMAASMSVSVVQEDTLWGLIACHHYSGPRYLPFDIRSACEILGYIVSLLLRGKQEQEQAGERVRLREVQAQLTEWMARDGRLTTAFTEHDPTILEFIAADGAAVCIDGETVLMGETPPAAFCETLTGWLAANIQSEVMATSALPALYPAAAAEAARAAGLLALAVTPARRDYVLWFRAEQVHTVTWGGDPEKPVSTAEDGLRLSPRKSFAVWQQTVRGQSRPWQPVDVAAARDLRAAIIAVVLQQAEAVATLNRELQRSNIELDEFAYVASHDLKEPLRGIHYYAQFLLQDYGERLDDVGRERLETLTRLTQRMEDLIESLLHYSRVGRLELALQDVDMDELLRAQLEALTPLLTQNNVEVRVQGPLPVVRADRVRAGEVLGNLLSNALKYNDKAERWIEIGAIQPENGPVVLYVRDNGIGIAANRHDAIFRIFRRLHGRDEFGGGAGAGLTIARKIAERHGGRLWLESIPGKGSTFYFTLEREHDRNNS